MKDLDIAERENFIKQNTFFVATNGIERLLMFLLGRTAASNAALLDTQIKKEFDGKYHRNDLHAEIAKKVKGLEEEMDRLENLEEERKKTNMKDVKALREIKNGPEKLQSAFIKQGVVGDLDEPEMERFVLNAPVSEIKEIRGKKRRKKGEKKKSNDLELFVTGTEGNSADVLEKVRYFKQKNS